MHWSSRERGSAGPGGKACPDTPAWCGAHRFPQPHARAAGASQARRCMRTHEQCHSIGPGPGHQLAWRQVLLAKWLGSACSCAGWGCRAACDLGWQWDPTCSTTPWSQGSGLPQPQAFTFLPPSHLCLPPCLVVLGWHHPIALQPPHLHHCGGHSALPPPNCPPQHAPPCTAPKQLSAA